MTTHLLTLADLAKEEFEAFFKRAIELKEKQQKGAAIPTQAGKSLGLLFDKPSTRTRVSFEVGMAQLGGTTIYLEREQTQLARNEPMPDTARVLSRYVEGVVMRTFAQETVAELARHADPRVGTIRPVRVGRVHLAGAVQLVERVPGDGHGFRIEASKTWRSLFLAEP